MIGEFAPRRPDPRIVLLSGYAFKVLFDALHLQYETFDYSGPTGRCDYSSFYVKDIKFICNEALPHAH